MVCPRLFSATTPHVKRSAPYKFASHIPGIERSPAYQQEYRAAQTQQRIDQVNARYADQLPAADVGLYYGKSGIQVLKISSPSRTAQQGNVRPLPAPLPDNRP